jgi:hypothetical protein
MACLLCFILHILVKLLFYVIFGVQYSYINLINLTIHNVKIVPSDLNGVSFHVGKIKLHLSIFFNPKSYVRLSIADVILDIKDINLEDNINDKQNSKYKNQSKEEELSEKLKSFEFNPEDPVSIYTKNKKLNRLIKFLIEFIPHLSFKIFNTNILVSSDLSITFKEITGETDIDRSIFKNSFLGKIKNPNHNWVSSIRIDSTNLYSTSKNQIISQFFNQCEASISFKLDINTGIIDSFEPRFRIIGIDISILYIIKLFKSIIPSFKIPEQKQKQKQQSPKKVKRISQYRLYLYAYVFRLLKNANYTIQNMNLTEIPIINFSKLNTFIDSENDKVFDNILFASASIDSINIDFKPISPSQVGYSLKFVKDSFPLQWMIILSNLKIALNYSKINSYTGEKKTFDVFAIPNLLLTSESSMMVNVLRVVFNNYMTENFIHKQTISIIQLTLTNPSVDISVEQLALLMKCLKEAKQANNKSIDSQINNDDDNDDITSEKIKDSVDQVPINKLDKDILLKTSPKFQIKILLEKPIFILKSNNEAKYKFDMHLFVLQHSMISIQFDSYTTATRNMKTSMRFDVPETSLIYQRNNLNTSSVTIALIRDILFKTSLQLFNLDNVRLSLDLSHLSIDLTNLQVLNGIGIIINLLKFFTNKHKISSKQIQKPIQNKNKSRNIDKLFSELPKWFSKMSCTFGDIKFKIGSKSLFMNSNDLLDENNDTNIFIDDKSITPSTIIYKIKKIDFGLVEKNIVFDEDTGSVGNSENSKTIDDYFWLIKGSITGTQLITSIQHPSFEKKYIEKILLIPEITTSFYCLKNKTFEFSTLVDSIIINHNVTSHFVLFSSFYLLRNVIKHHEKQLFSQFDQDADVLNYTNSNEEVIHQKEKKIIDKSNENNKNIIKKSKFELVNLKWYIKEIQFKFLMPGTFNFRLDLFDLKGLAQNNSIVLQHKLIRLSVKKDPTYEFFNKLLSFDNMKVVCQLPSEKHNLARISIYDSKIKLSIPSNFIVHSLFDAIVLTMKLTKKFIRSIKQGPTSTLDKISASGIMKLPKINLKTDSLSFVIEDDPFETELGMIYQLGLIEQQSRLEKFKYFRKSIDQLREDATNSIANDVTLKKFNECLDNIYSLDEKINFTDEELVLNSLIDECLHNLHKLRVNISKSWIKVVEEFKLKRRNVVEMNMDYLTGSLISNLSVSPTFNSKMVDFNDSPPLMGLHFNDLILSIKPPKFKDDLNDVHEFLYRVGKGIPKETVWDKIIPMNLVIKAAEVRIHLRDFPLPMVYIPNSKAGKRWSNTFIFQSNMAIAEPMPISDREYWYLYIPMFEDMSEGSIDDFYYSWKAPKTICSVKTYYEIDCNINSDNATSVTWSTGYQAVLRQLNHNFDTFSKLTKDPSSKLGVWDKLRNIMHGYARFNWLNDDSEVKINILNSYDPYRLLTFSAGFTLSFRDNVRWLINDPTRELERDYFIFRSKSIIFGIPNHLAEPLPCWCSKQLIFLPLNAENILLASMYGYYLNTDTYYTGDLKSRNLLTITRNHRFKTYNICLNGELEIKLTMAFERELPDGTRTREFKSHFENVLTNPDYVQGIENFDSYKGFRSDYIHMSFGLTAKNSSYNILRLTARTVFQFLRWFKRFSSDPSLPIRIGTLWSSKSKSIKFGAHLMTFKFMFDVEPLYIYHGYRIDLAKPQNQTAIGFKAKIKSFKCDLHERKEKKVKHVDFFNTDLNVMKLAFYIGKVDLNDIDLRMIGLTFADAKDNDSPRHRFEIYDDDDDWVDLNDFEEVDIPTLRNFDINGQIFPLLYASHFTYWLNKKVTKNKFGDEDTHDCLIDTEGYPDKSYNHLFEIAALKLKWYCNVRNLVFEYLAELEFRASYIYSMSYKARRAVAKKIELLDDDKIVGRNIESKMPEFDIKNKEDFGNTMRNVKEYVKTIISVDHMLVKLEDVQIQIMVDPADEHMMLFRTQHNEIEIVSLMDNDWYHFVESATLATRYGTMFENADILIISKKEYATLNKTNIHYGSTESWPAFLDGDEPEKFIKEKTLLSDVLIYFVFEKSSNNYAGAKTRNKMYLNIPKFETKIDSESYLKSLKIIKNVIDYTSPQQKQFAEMVQTVSLATSSQDQKILFKQLEHCGSEIYQLLVLHQALTPLRYVSEDEQNVDTIIRSKLSKLFANTLLLSKILLLAVDSKRGTDKDDNCFVEWVVKAKNVNVDFVENGNSFLNFNLKDISFSRLELLDKSTSNELKIKSFEILNKDYNILFPDLLTPVTSDIGDEFNNYKYLNRDDMLKVKWNLDEKVGGMHNIRDFQIFCHPMKLRLETKTGIKLMHFLFPNESQYQVDKSDDESDNLSDEYFEEIYDDDDFSKPFEHQLTETTEIIHTDDNVDLSTLEVSSIKVEKSNSQKGRSTDTVDRFSTSDDSDEYVVNNLFRKNDQSSKVDSNLTKISKARYSIALSYSDRLNKKIISGSLINTSSIVKNLMQMGVDADIEIDGQSSNMKEISERANKYFSIRNLELNSTMLIVTLHGTGLLRLLNVTNLRLMVPAFSVRKKIWTSLDLINAIKKHVILALLKQTGRLLKNKIFIHKHRKRYNKLKKAKIS